MLNKKSGILFHGSLVNIDGNGVIFTGKSGAGKSTLSELFVSSGYKKIGDDRLILTIDRQGRNVWAYSTPFDLKLSSWVNEKISLKQLVCLSHSKNGENNVCKLNTLQSILPLILTNFLPLFATKYIDIHFQIYKEILQDILLFDYSFVPNETSVKYLIKELNACGEH